MVMLSGPTTLLQRRALNDSVALYPSAVLSPPNDTDCARVVRVQFVFRNVDARGWRSELLNLRERVQNLPTVQPPKFFAPVPWSTHSREKWYPCAHVQLQALSSWGPSVFTLWLSSSVGPLRGPRIRAWTLLSVAIQLSFTVVGCSSRLVSHSMDPPL